MPISRKTFEEDGHRYIVIPYTGFRDLGIYAEPQIPLEVVPLFDRVEDSLAEPLRQVKQFEDTLHTHNIDILSAIVTGTKRGSYESKLQFPAIFFRGERREQYSIQPTLLRRADKTIPELWPRTIRKLEQVQRILAWKIRLALFLSDRHWLTELQARAAARHYGAASTLVDFSFDPHVAAYFAHPPLRDAERADLEAGKVPVGIIYGLRYDVLQQSFPMQSFFLGGRTGNSISFPLLTDTIRTSYLTYNEEREKIDRATCVIDFRPDAQITFRAVAVPRIGRIRAQQGLFIELDLSRGAKIIDAIRLWYVLDFLAEKWCFLRRDEQFEVPPSITSQALFPKDQRLVRWAAGSN
jgi:FRG domain